MVAGRIKLSRRDYAARSAGQLPPNLLVWSPPLPQRVTSRSAHSESPILEEGSQMKQLLAITMMATTAFAGVAVVGAASPASAACDAMSVGTPYHSGSNVKSSASICAATNWTAFVSIERWRGTYWDTIGSEQAIHGAGPGVTKQGPITRGCGGTGTYTYRGKIWMTNGISFTSDEYSAQTRFSC
jgi:hypothetical protein